MASRPQVAVLTRVPPSVLEALAPHVDLVEGLGDAEAVLVSSGVPIDAALLAQAPKLKLIASSSVGYDNVDQQALRARGIALTNARGSLDEAVADLTYALIIIAMRRLGGAMAWARDGRWMRGDAPFGNDLEGATLGIVGFGSIGPKIARRAFASGMRVIYSNRTPRDDDAQTGASWRSFEGLLAEADCVVALVPLTPATRGLFGDAAFAAMKPSAVFVNVARGAIADTGALLRALDASEIAGAALDVTNPEPLPPDHPLHGRDDVLIVPHVGSATTQTRTRMAMLAARNVLAFAAGEPLLTEVALG
ncbi:MAG TPA: D-glycerate dehydrogenase [Candidatus Elarobacter sp.]